MHSIKVETKQYVSFNPDSGEIYAIGPSQEEGYQHIEITEEQAYPIKTFKDKMEDYKVIFSSVTKQHELRKLENNEDENQFVLHQLQEKRKDPYFDVVFSVDKKTHARYKFNLDYSDNQKRFSVFCKSAIEAARILPFGPAEIFPFAEPAFAGIHHLASS